MNTETLQYVLLPHTAADGHFIVVVPEWPEVRGISVGSCIGNCQNGATPGFPDDPSDTLGHAHNWRHDKWFGWICLRDRERLFSRHGGLSWVCWHEYAHILTPNHWHDDVWRRKMIDLGQEIPERYRKRSRTRDLLAAVRA